MTNDFPPKVGGIQQYLGELYRRLDPNSFAVVTTQWPGSETFDRELGALVVRRSQRLLPSPALVQLVHSVAAEIGADLVVLDPLWPLGEVGRRLRLPWVGVAHGAEFTIPARLPVARARVGRCLRTSAGAIAAGSFVGAAVATLAPSLPVAVVPPGVDVEVFRPNAGERSALRARLMVEPTRHLVLFVSRLVPRKGAHIAIDALARLEGVELHVVGDGRARRALEDRARRRDVTTVFRGAVSASELVEYYQAADVFVFPAPDRWFGFEQEGFGIVLLEAQACGVPVVAGLSGGTAEAVDPESGTLVVGRGRRQWARAIETALSRWRAPAPAARTFVETRFDYDQLAARWTDGLASLARRGGDAGSSYPQDHHGGDHRHA